MLDQGETIGCVLELPDGSYMMRCEARESTNAQRIHLRSRTGGTVLAYPAFVLEYNDRARETLLRFSLTALRQYPAHQLLQKIPRQEQDGSSSPGNMWPP